jgi:hypothetical protein
MGFTPKLLHNGGTISDVSRPLLAPNKLPQRFAKDRRIMVVRTAVAPDVIEAVAETKDFFELV